MTLAQYLNPILEARQAQKIIEDYNNLINSLDERYFKDITKDLHLDLVRINEERKELEKFYAEFIKLGEDEN